MQKRISLKHAEPAAYKAMLAFDAYTESIPVSNVHKDLIKIRASQINGCSYCIDMHTKEAREHGEKEQRIYGLSSWRETPFFTDEERAILALTEEVTLISNRVSDETYANAAKLLDEKYLSQVLMVILVINSWNRIGVATNLIPSLS
ncbi:MAG TPA: carboxymuconolactone decarboxylase family protein [Puia sp.]|nr:carboxymuconolactone decarboxylase family protein [Puia sp.]